MTTGPSQKVAPDEAVLLVVILNYNGLSDTLACLDSLRRQTMHCQILVIDNGSRAAELDVIGAQFPEVETLGLPENLGWAGGNNVGLRMALDRGASHVCLLNNDTILDPTALAEMRAAATRYAEPCLLHPTIAYAEGPLTWQLNPQPASPAPFGPDLVEMDFAYGACLMLPAATVRRVGLFDERFFLQLEETDYFHRARALGMRSLCARKARIVHKESPSFGGRVTGAKTYYQVRNTLLLTEKHTPTPAGFLAAFRRLAWSLRGQAEADRGPGATFGEGPQGWRRFMIWLLSSHPLARAARQGVWHYARRTFGPRPAPRVTM